MLSCPKTVNPKPTQENNKNKHRVTPVINIWVPQAEIYVNVLLEKIATGVHRQQEIVNRPCCWSALACFSCFSCSLLVIPFLLSGCWNHHFLANRVEPVVQNSSVLRLQCIAGGCSKRARHEIASFTPTSSGRAACQSRPAL